MAKKNELLEKIVTGIQERKGKRITIVDLTKLDAICEHFVICEGTSNTHILSVVDSIKDVVREELSIKPYAVDGTINALWIAMDYGDIMVHVFEKESRQYYNLEHLWSDAKLSEVPDLE